MKRRGFIGMLTAACASLFIPKTSVAKQVHAELPDIVCLSSEEGFSPALMHDISSIKCGSCLEELAKWELKPITHAVVGLYEGQVVKFGGEPFLIESIDGSITFKRIMQDTRDMGRLLTETPVTAEQIEENTKWIKSRAIL